MKLPISKTAIGMNLINEIIGELQKRKVNVHPILDKILFN